MTMLEKSKALFARDEHGEIIPQKRTLSIEGHPEVSVTPLTRGEIKRLFSGDKSDTDRQEDEEIIKNHCKNPQFTDDELVNIKTYMSNAIVTAIMLASELVEHKDQKNQKNPNSKE